MANFSASKSTSEIIASMCIGAIPCTVPGLAHCVRTIMAYSHSTRMGPAQIKGTGLAQWVLIPVSKQCEHFYIVVHFPLGPCTGTVPVQCE